MTTQSTTTPRPVTQFTIAWLVLFSVNSHGAGITGDVVEEIKVFGENFHLQGTPLTATEGFVLGDQLALRPVSRPAELLEFIPGLIATQHSGEGKGNQYFLRGFNLDHGTDLALRVDGLPVNMPSHAHGQGYADINFLLPEMVESLSYRKGPYYAEIGDFGTAGSSEFHYANSLERPVVSVTTGEYNFQRVFAGGSVFIADGQLTVAGAHTGYDGPWTLDQALDKSNALIKFHKDTQQGDWSITGMGYENSWNSSDQIPLRVVSQNLLGNYDTVDNTDGGDTHRYSVSLKSNYTNDLGTFSLSAYAIDYDLALFSNFTYFLEDPVRGDQFEQSEQRHVLGFDASFKHNTSLFDFPTAITLGLQNRFDSSSLGLYKTQTRARHSITREDDIRQSLTSLYGAAKLQLTNNLRSTLAVRIDRLDYSVDSILAVNSGEGNASLVSPKASVAYSLSHATELFLSAGLGFHSNDVRGATTLIDPSSGDPAQKVDPLAKARSVEAGIRTAIIPRTQIAISAFSLALDSELVYVGDAGTTEALGGSRRQGIELGVLYSPAPWLLIDADLTATKGRFNNGASGKHIPNSVARTAALGVTISPAQKWNAGLRLRYLGSAPLIEDDTVRADSTIMLNAQASYQISDNVTLSLEAFNLTDSRDNDITYFYESQLKTEVQPLEDYHFHPVEPRSFRLTLDVSL